MKLSIITINRNNAEGLRKTMQSVVTQTLQDFEYIVIDGASTDGSVAVVESFKDRLTYWISEPDAGIYNAMNKGIRKAKGEYLLFLNSGDCLIENNIIERISPYLGNEDVVQGNISLFHDNEWRIERGYGKSNLSFIDVQQGLIPHPSSFCRKSLFEQYGYFDETYKIVSDTVFFIKVLGFGNATFKYVDINVTICEPGGVSNSQDQKWIDVLNNEIIRMNKSLFSDRLFDICLTAPKKINFYDKLHSNKSIWYCAILLHHIATFFCRYKKY